ncbi:ABC transporter ATP-binding protein [Euzebya sp.]|uniref:ABC transporter ATP-binding protein n=1 Tax=Euzebya sp. TaxID=1971409 RepID=UPI003518E05E
MDERPTLAVDDLVRRFGDLTAVDGVTFHIAPGEAYGLLGPNGAGKTTTISMAMGLLEPDAGTVEVAGVDMATEPMRAKRQVGYVPQEIALYPDLTARENLDFVARLHGLDASTRRARIGEALDLVGLADRADERIDTYSGGMQRRINIAAGLLHHPSLLILDEPTVGVDPQSRNAILEGVAELSRTGMSILYTSHYMEEVERLCDRVGIVDGGRLIAEGTQRELVSRVGSTDRVELAVDGDAELIAKRIGGLDTVIEATAEHDDGAWTVRVLTADARRHLATIVAAAEGRVIGVEIVEPDLESVFLSLTGRGLRD